MTSRLSDSFLRIHDEDPCLLCNRSIKKGDQFNTFTEKGWATLKKNAIKWSNINVPVDDDCYMFPSVQDRVKDRLVFGRGHKGCRRIFSGKINQYQEKYGEKSAIENDEKRTEDLIGECIELLILITNA